MTKQPHRGHWSGSTRGPAVKRKPCPFGCGAHVDEFREPHGLLVRLDVRPPSVDLDLSTVDPIRLYQYHGPRIGWAPKFLPERGWRELRLVHECPFPQSNPVPNPRMCTSTSTRTPRRPR